MNILAFDIGGTFIKYGWIKDNGDIIKASKVKTPRESLESLLDVIEKIYKESEVEVEGLTFSIPGIVDVEKGYIFNGGSLQYNNETYFASKVEERIKLPVTIENDARCAALAEIWHGKMKDIDAGIVMVLGTGVGGSLIKDGKLHKGRHLFSGEFSYMLTRDLKTYGLAACFGEQGSIVRLVERIGHAIGKSNIDGVEAFKYISEEDDRVLPIFQSYLKDLALQIYNLQAIYDPTLICIGGGASKQDILIDGIRSALTSLYDSIPVKMTRAKIQRCKYSNDSNLIGAVYNFINLRGIKNEL